MRRIARTLVGSAGASMLALALLVCGCVFAALAGPAQSQRAQTEALHKDLAQQGETASAVTVSTDWDAVTTQLNPGQEQIYLSEDELASARDALAGSLAAASLPVAAGSWTGLSTRPYPVASGAAASAFNSGLTPTIEVLYRDPLAANAPVVAGRYTSTGQPPGSLGVAVTTATAARFGLRPGSRLRLTLPTGPVTLVVTALLRIRGPAATFWNADSTAAVPSLTQLTSGNWVGAVFADPGQLTAMQMLFSAADMNISWEIPLSPGQVQASRVQALDNALNRFSVTSPSMGELSAAATAVTVSSPLTSALAAFLDTQAAIETVLLLLFVSLIVTAAAVIAVAARMVAVRRAGELTMMRARGASLRQVAALMLRATAAVSGPAAMAGAGLAFAAETRDTPSVLGWSLAGLVLVTALAGPPLAAAWRHRRPSPASNPARVTTTETAGFRRVALRRWVAEATACAAAVAALVVLHSQGLPTAGQPDLFLAATPVLVAIPVVVVVLRLYPLAVRGLARLSARTAGATGFIALARASRTSLTGVLPVFALVLGLSVAAFAGMVRSAVTRGEVAASWQATGADVVVDTGTETQPGFVPHPVTGAAQKAIAAVPGVRRSARVWKTSWTAPGGQQLTVLAVDPSQYTALVASTPFPRFPAAAIARTRPVPAGATVAVLASPAAAAILGGGSPSISAPSGIGPVSVRVAGKLSSTPAQTGSGAWIIMPMVRLPGPNGQPAPQLLLLTGSGINDARLSAVVAKVLPPTNVTFRSAALTALAGAPLQHDAGLIMLLTILTAAALGLGTLVIGLALGSAERELTLARLTTMGHEKPLRLLVAETLPAVLAAAVAGLACALALPALTGPALDLSVFTGTGAPIPPRPDWLALGLPVAAIVAIAAAALAAETTALRRRGVTGLLRAH
ncbi:MAG: hypothetical protein ABSF03_28205 [Streptosporangiaceae bacterium]